jgi:hypothetical protein
MMPDAYAFRDKLAACFYKWYAYAREHFDASMISKNGDSDPTWGSAMMRQRQEAFSAVDHHDDEAIA